MTPTPRDSSGASKRDQEPALPAEPAARELGRKIKLLRVSRDLTLKDLEKRGGISSTHISEIERGSSSPTVGALGKIASALGVRPAALVEPEVLPKLSHLRAAARAQQRLTKGTATIEPLAESTRGRALCGHMLTLGVARKPAFTHRHDGEEWVTLLSGVAEIHVAGKSHILREGDSLHFRAHQLHDYANLGPSPAVLVMVCRPRVRL
jgi:transcriptional regulator with XRE-family HTH domain